MNAKNREVESLEKEMQSSKDLFRRRLPNQYQEYGATSIDVTVDAGASRCAKQAGNKSEETEFAGKQGGPKQGSDKCAGV